MDAQSQIANRKLQIDLVIFDLGRVLVRICNNYREACERAGICRADDLGPFDGEATARDHEAVVLLDTGKIDLEEFARRVAPHRKITPKEVIRAYDAFLLEPYPGAIELIDELNATGVKTACLSNTSHGHWNQMCDRAHPAHFPLDRLTWRFASQLVGAVKPTDAIFEHVERTTGFRGDQILFFDDLEENVAAAAKRGWRACLIRLDSDPIAQARAALRDEHVLNR